MSSEHTPRQAVELIAACCQLQAIADHPDCDDDLLVALHIAMDELSALADRMQAA